MRKSRNRGRPNQNKSSLSWTTGVPFTTSPLSWSRSPILVIMTWSFVPTRSKICAKIIKHIEIRVDDINDERFFSDGKNSFADGKHFSAQVVIPVVINTEGKGAYDEGNEG